MIGLELPVFISRVCLLSSISFALGPRGKIFFDHKIFTIVPERNKSDYLYDPEPYSLYLGNYELDFDESWSNCWNLGPIDCVEIS